MIIITWNIQWGLGCDGRVDLDRIVRTAREMGDFDVLCLQEIADNYPGLKTPVHDNQWQQIAELLPGFHAIEGITVERYTQGVGRQRFGNMMLTRDAPLQVLRHSLPWTADAHQPSMPRGALEVVLPFAGSHVRVVTTHLEYYSAMQRSEQIEALRKLQTAAASHAHAFQAESKKGTPFEARPRNSRGILCGDFNCSAADPLIARLQESDEGTIGWRDCWPIANPAQAHPTTVGAHDHEQWPQGGQCFDMFFVSEDLTAAVKRVTVDSQTEASDHQPLMLEIESC